MPVTPHPVPALTGRFRRLRDDSWGAQVSAEGDLTGRTITMVRRDGTEQVRVLGERVARYRDVRHPALYALMPPADEPRPAHQYQRPVSPGRLTDLMARMTGEVTPDGHAIDDEAYAEAAAERAAERRGFASDPDFARSAERVAAARRVIASGIAALRVEADVPVEECEDAMSTFDALASYGPLEVRR